jgi:hypothetical protein
VPGRIRSIKKSNYLIGDRTRDLLASEHSPSTYYATTWLVEKLTVTELVKEISRPLWNRKVHHLFPQEPATGPYLQPDESNPHPYTNSLKINFNITSHLLLGLPSYVLPSDFPTKISCTFIPSSVHATCPAKIMYRDLAILIIFREEYALLNFSSCRFPPAPSTSSLLCQKYSPQHPVMIIMH